MALIGISYKLERISYTLSNNTLYMGSSYVRRQNIDFYILYKKLI